MNATTEAIVEQATAALEDLCQRKAVWRVDLSTVAISSGFSLPDGDEYPIILEESPKGWSFTDRGAMMGRFGMLSVSTSETVDNQIRAVVEATGCHMTDDWTLSMPVGEKVTADALAAFIEAIARVQAVADLPLREPSGPQFPRTVRDALRSLVRADVEINDRWTDPTNDVNESYPVDLRIKAPAEEVLIWTVSGFDKADTPIVCRDFLRFRRSSSPWQAAAIVNQTRMPRSPEMHRLQESFGDENVLVASSTDSAALRGFLDRKGVPTA